MYDYMLTDEAIALRDKTRDFAKNEVDPEYLRRMDRDEIQYPRELYQKYAERGLLGLRFPKKYGGREMNWMTMTTCGGFWIKTGNALL